MGKRLFVLAYPTLKTADFDWIQAIRAEHDKQFGLVEPHFTLVFGTTAVSETDLTAHMQQQLAPLSAFQVVCRCATVVKDSFSPDYHVFLLPDEGNSQLIKLHDTLYTHVLASELRLDIPYLPHMTIASFAGPLAAKQLADQLNGEAFAVTGLIDEVTMVALGGGKLTAVAPAADATMPLRQL